MYLAHPSFRPPPLDAVLWRYMDFVKFISLLERKALFFAQASQLGDPFEGSISKHTQVEIQQKYREVETDLHKAIYKYRDQILVNCWHKCDHESAAMWTLYGEHIAIQTTMERLRDSFVCEDDVFIGEVSYVDYEDTPISVENFLNFYVHKRRSFEHEQEVRAVVKVRPRDADLPRGGKYIPIDTEKLIDQVVIAPHADEWFSDLVHDLAKKYKLDSRVRASSLAITPLF